MLDHPHMAAVMPPTRTHKYSFHSFRKFFATSLSMAKVPRERIQSMCRWTSAESVEGYDILGFEDHTALLDKAYTCSPNSITPAVLSALSKLTLNDNAHVLEWCTECNVDLNECDKLDWPLDERDPK